MLEHPECDRAFMVVSGKEVLKGQRSFKLLATEVRSEGDAAVHSHKLLTCARSPA